MESPQIVVVSIIVRKNKFLLVKRAREPFKNHWSIISGLSVMNKKYSSDPLQASNDEVLGDIKCEFTNSKFYTYIFSKGDRPTISLIFFGQIKGTPIINTKYVSDYKWFSIDEVRNLDLAFEHREILQQFFKEFISE